MRTTRAGCAHVPVRARLRALAFVVDRKHAQYAGELSVEEQAKVLGCATGAFGSSADYLEHTRIALITHGVVDPYLETLAAQLATRRR